MKGIYHRFTDPSLDPELPSKGEEVKNCCSCLWRLEFRHR